MIQHVVLVIAVLMAGEAPDIRHRVEITSGDMELCWKKAREWVARPTPQIPGAIGMGATCAIYVDDEAPDEDEDQQ